MRAGSVVAIVALSLFSVACYADTVVENFTANGSGSSDISSSAFSQFDPSLGTLNSITVDLTGTDYTGNVQVSDEFKGLAASNDQSSILVVGTGEDATGQTFSISADGTFSTDLSYFEGTGTATLVLEFTANPNTTTDTSGTVTYSYTPVATPPAATPEPSSLVLLGSGVLGVAGVVRRRISR